MAAAAASLRPAENRNGGLAMLGIIIVVLAAAAAILLFIPTKLYGGPKEMVPIPIQVPGGREESLDEMIRRVANRYGVDPALVKAIIRQESNFNPYAVNPSDPSYGLMQIMPILGQDFGIVKEWQNPTESEIAMIKDPETNIRCGTWFLSTLLKDNPLDAAIQMYNVGRRGYNEGRRNADYLAKVKRFYNEYQSNQ